LALGFAAATIGLALLVSSMNQDSEDEPASAKAATAGAAANTLNNAAQAESIEDPLSWQDPLAGELYEVRSAVEWLEESITPPEMSGLSENNAAP
jgi:hypothetical protein